MSLKQELWVTVTKDPRLVPLYSSIGCGLELLKPQDSSHNLQCYTEHVQAAHRNMRHRDRSAASSFVPKMPPLDCDA